MGAIYIEHSCVWLKSGGLIIKWS